MSNLNRNFLYKIFNSNDYNSSFFISFDKSLDLSNSDGAYTKCLSNLAFHTFEDCFNYFNKIIGKTKFVYNTSKNFAIKKINIKDLEREGIVLKEETLEKINRLNKCLKEGYGYDIKERNYGNNKDQSMTFEFVFDNTENNIYFHKTIQSKDIVDRSHIFRNITTKKHFAEEIDRILVDKSDKYSIYKNLYYDKYYITNRLKALRFYYSIKNTVKVGVCEKTGKELFTYETIDDVIDFYPEEFVIFKEMIKYHTPQIYLINCGFSSSNINMTNKEECIVAYGTIEPEFIGFLDSTLYERVADVDKEFGKLSHDEKIKLMNIYGLIK